MIHLVSAFINIGIHVIFGVYWFPATVLSVMFVHLSCHHLIITLT